MVCVRHHFNLCHEVMTCQQIMLDTILRTCHDFKTCVLSKAGRRRLKRVLFLSFSCFIILYAHGGSRISSFQPSVIFTVGYRSLAASNHRPINNNHCPIHKCVLKTCNGNTHFTHVNSNTIRTTLENRADIQLLSLDGCLCSGFRLIFLVF
jgi:hypothetical protein